VFTNVNSALAKANSTVLKKNYIGGLGGRDITKNEIENMFNELLTGKLKKDGEHVEFFNLKVAIDE